MSTETKGRDQLFTGEAGSDLSDNQNWRPRERREKLFIVEQSVLVHMICASNVAEFIRLPVHPDIPEGATVVGVHPMWDRRAIGVIIADDSYPVVPEGAERPIARVVRINEFRRIPVAETHELAAVDRFEHPADNEDAPSAFTREIVDPKPVEDSDTPPVDDESEDPAADTTPDEEPTQGNESN